MDLLTGLVAGLALGALGSSGIVRALVAHTLKHPLKDTVIRLDANRHVVSVTDREPTRERDVAGVH